MLKLRALLSVILAPILIFGLESMIWASDSRGPYSDISVTTIQNDPITLLAGTEVVIDASVTNAGSEPTEPSKMIFLLSMDQNLELTDFVLGERIIASYTKGSGFRTSWRGGINQAPGIYWIGVCVPRGANEINDKNNCSEAREVTVPLIDLSIGFLELQPSRFVSGIPITLRAALDNKGSAASQPSRVRYVLSANPSISPQDPLILEQEAPAIAAGKRWGEPVTGKVNSGPGKYWVGACLIPQKGDIDAKNDCSSAYEVEVLKNEFPDLVLERVSARPETWAEGKEVDFYAEIINIGAGPSSETKVTFYLSEDSDIYFDDVEIGQTMTESLAPNEQFNAYLVAAPAVFPGVYWIGACIEADSMEFDSYNNCAAGGQVEIQNYVFIQ